MRLLSGKLPVTASGVLADAAGHGTLRARIRRDLRHSRAEDACCSRSSATTRAARRIPDGVNLDDAFELPARIREIRVQPGQAIVVQ